MEFLKVQRGSIKYENMTIQKCGNGLLTSATAWSADSIFSKVTKAQLVRDRGQNGFNIKRRNQD